MNSTEIISFINNVIDGNAKPLEEYKAYAVKGNGTVGVAIDTDTDLQIDEKFNNVELANAVLTIKGVEHKTFYLFTRDSFLDEHYGALCLDFLNLKNRGIISQNPFTWFEEWSTLLGNSKKEKMVYDVIGELKSILILKQNGLDPKWESIENNTFDISANNNLYEVKTTRNKTGTFVTIHNQFQLSKENDQDLYILFLRVEQNDSGVSINDLYDSLKQSGFKVSNIDDYLTKIGYGVGKKDRSTKFLIHEVRQYKVNENFPKITKESFKNNQFPNGVVKIEYTISLDGLAYDILEEQTNAKNI